MAKINLDYIGVFDYSDSFIKTKTKSLILGSGSPRRRELLSYICDDFTIIKPEIDEDLILKKALEKFKGEAFITKASKATAEIALEKAKKIYSIDSSKTIITADTTVIHNEEILGKPKDEKDALDTLNSLMGDTHYVSTAVCIFNDLDDYEAFYVTSKVEFQDKSLLMDNFLKRYIESKEPMDKAGSYGIQNLGSLMIKNIYGDYYNIVGLPIAELYKRLGDDYEDID